ncbi:MAG: hypothetical protein KA444_02015 [Bacteroidia bacterium]|nr:hypothetical protein [Bacteroidia bacterium]
MAYYENLTANSASLGLSSEHSAGFLPTQPHVVHVMGTVPSEPQYRLVADKNYELTDHLGNVRVKVSDRKNSSATLTWPVSATYSNNLIADIQSVNNYYAGGMLMPGRTFSSSEYRYGHNSQEKTDEIKGSGNHYTAMFWEYDSRIGRRWNLDPIIKEHESPYATFANNPIWFTDPNGADTVDLKLNKDIFEITKRTNASGNDIFRLNHDGNITTYTFSEGEYGDRVNCLNLESTDKYTLGVYQVSGKAEEEGGVGFYVTPGGTPSTKVNSKRSLPDGSYTLSESYNSSKWVMPWVVSSINSEVAARGIKWHPALSKTASSWTEGCFVIFPNYTMGKCLPQIVPSKSVQAAFNFVRLLGAHNVSDKLVGDYCRITSDFEESNIGQLNLKSTWTK